MFIAPKVSAREVFVQRALPAYQKFMTSRAERTFTIGEDLKQFIDIADALLNLPDYLWKESPPIKELSGYRDARQYRESFWAGNHAYEVICDVANSDKHRVISRDGRTLKGIEDIHECFAVCRFRDPHGEYYRVFKTVTVTGIDGCKYLSWRLLSASMQMWADELLRLGLIPQLPDNTFHFSEYIDRDDPIYKVTYNVSTTAGEPFTMSSLPFDYSKSKQYLEIRDPSNPFRHSLSIIVNNKPSPFQV